MRPGSFHRVDRRDCRSPGDRLATRTPARKEGRGRGRGRGKPRRPSADAVGNDAATVRSPQGGRIVSMNAEHERAKRNAYVAQGFQGHDLVARSTRKAAIAI